MFTTSKVVKFDRWYQYKSLCEISSKGVNFSAIHYSKYSISKKSEYSTFGEDFERL